MISPRESLPYPLALFDGDCGFCQAAVARLQRWAPQAAHWLPHQAFTDSQLDSIGVSRESCDLAIQFIRVPGAIPQAGADAINSVLADTRFFRAFILFFQMRCILHCERFAYRLVARRRSWLSGVLGKRLCGVSPPRIP